MAQRAPSRLPSMIQGGMGGFCFPADEMIWPDLVTRNRVLRRTGCDVAAASSEGMEDVEGAELNRFRVADDGK